MTALGATRTATDAHWSGMQRQNSVELLESIRARLLDPSWLDTAVARASALAIIVGEAKTIAEALGRPE
jgi:hypothetical protein